MRKKLYDQERRFKIKFILTSIKEIVTDGRERYYFLKEGDKVFRDVFLEKKFISKLLRCSRCYESNIILDEIGIETLHELFNTSSYMDILRTMIELVCKLNQLEYKIRKLEKKKKNVPKSLSKEYHWVKDLYKKSVKRLRKDLRLKDSIPYKEKYKNILKYVKNKKPKNMGFDIFDDDFDPIYDEIYDYDDDFDDDDNYSDDRYADFIRNEKEKINRRKNKSNKRRRKNPHRESDIDYDDDFDDDDYEDYGEGDDNVSESERLSNVESQVRSINKYLTSQNGSINNSYNKSTRPDLGPDFEFYEDDTTDEPVSQESPGSEIIRKMDAIVNTILKIADNQENLSERLTSIETDLYDDVRDDDDNDEPSPPQIIPGGSDPIANVQ